MRIQTLLALVLVELVAVVAFARSADERTTWHESTCDMTLLSVDGFVRVAAEAFTEPDAERPENPALTIAEDVVRYAGSTGTDGGTATRLERSTLFVPPPRTACVVYVLADPAPGSRTVVLRQFHQGQVRERVVSVS